MSLVTDEVLIRNVWRNVKQFYALAAYIFFGGLFAFIGLLTLTGKDSGLWAERYALVLGPIALLALLAVALRTACGVSALGIRVRGPLRTSYRTWDQIVAVTSGTSRWSLWSPTALIDDGGLTVRIFAVPTQKIDEIGEAAGALGVGAAWDRVLAGPHLPKA
jgi:hypothetical protein